MLIKLAWRNIWRSRRRSIITIASILFAVFFAVIARSFQLGMYEKMIGSMVSNSTGYIQLHTKGYWDDQTIDNSLRISDANIPAIIAVEEVETVIPRLEGFALSAYKDMTKAVRVNGIDPEDEHLMTGIKDKLIAGEYLVDSSDQAMITEGLASFYELGIGDTLYLLGQGYHASNAAGRYIVSGIVEFAHPVLNAGSVYLSLKEAQWFFSAPDLVTGLVINLKDPSQMEKVQAQVAGKIDTASIEIMNWKEMLPELVQAIEMDSAGGIIMIFILYMVVSFGIFGTILMMTAERKTEFGMLIAIGMKRGLLSFVTVIEIVILSFMGIIAGLLAAMPLVHYFNSNPIKYTGQAAEAIKEYGFEPVIPTSIDISIAYTHGLVIMAIAIILAVYPVYNIFKLKAVTAMRG